MTTTSKKAPGMVYLVGAGPGDPGLITLRAVECLAGADAILYDYLANPAALAHASASAELIGLGHHASGRVLSPDEIITLTINEAKKGKTVVRLKGGDPSIFGRGADEVHALRGAGIPYEIIPGITASLAVAAYCEIPVTHHDGASAVALVAGRERDDKAKPDLDYGTLAQFPGTLVFYMGVTRAGIWSRAMIEQGKSPDTPVAIVRWCSWPRQQMVRCTLATVADVIAEQKIRPPALFVVGQVVKHAPQLSWFSARPLCGRCVLLAGTRGVNRELLSALSVLGAEVVTSSVTRIVDPASWTSTDAALGTLEQYEGVIFAGAASVDRFLHRLFDRGRDVRCLGSLKLATINTGAAERLAHYHLRADIQLEDLDQAEWPRALVSGTDSPRFLLACRDGDPILWLEAVASLGGRVDPVGVCAEADSDVPVADVAKELASGRIDWVAVTTPSEAAALVERYGSALSKSRLACLDSATSTKLAELGYDPTVEAAPQTAAALVAAIVSAAPEGR